ncbi:hypothetical protein [Cupriavidus basilensis]|uniref:Uncharacterized protein n=1 Tax=Cupriavidus basilensis TaxID=68895 RepID=A0A643FSY5_9BURK|nr:hypothetical protein [Cupriavidus basilensis]QOT82240.1 hypothetical protein F7R26_039720 [Cupriavidus basilensis]
MNLIPEGAIATLVAVDRTQSDHQIPSTMGVYSYEASDHDAELWTLEDLERDGDGSLRLDAEGSKISIYGPSVDNMHNANNIASMLGWKTCQLFGKDAASEQAVLRQLVNVDVLNAPPTSAAEIPPPAAPVQSHPPSVPPARRTSASREDAFIDLPPGLDSPVPHDGNAGIPPAIGGHDAGQLADITQVVEDLAAAEAERDRLADELRSASSEKTRLQVLVENLQRENRTLKTSGAQVEPGATSSALLNALIQCAEAQLAERLTAGAPGEEPLLGILRAHGFGIRLNIVPMTA